MSWTTLVAAALSRRGVSVVYPLARNSRITWWADLQFPYSRNLDTYTDKHTHIYLCVCAYVCVDKSMTRFVIRRIKFSLFIFFNTIPLMIYNWALQSTKRKAVKWWRKWHDRPRDWELMSCVSRLASETFYRRHATRAPFPLAGGGRTASAWRGPSHVLHRLLSIDVFFFSNEL